MMQWRGGQGCDGQALVPRRPLVICGVRIPHPRGLMGYPQAKMLLHGVTDPLR